MPKTPQEIANHYQDRVKKASPLIDGILKKHNLNLGAQFNTAKWPSSLEPVAVYLDMFDHDKVEIIVPEVIAGGEVDKPVEEPKEEGTLSPIQPEDLGKEGEAA